MCNSGRVVLCAAGGVVVVLFWSFFFSSRRRHTRCLSDWSSDVCSSDLNAVVALIGSGVGACLISGGSIYRGATSSAGEWGHTTIVAGGRRCRCGSAGCLEAYVGAEAILERYGRPMPGHEE